MKRLPARGVLRVLLAAAALLALAVGLASLPWHGDRPFAPPRVVASAAGAGQLRAGAAEIAFALPPGVPIGGFARWSYASEGVRDPVAARAVVLATPGCKVALASADVLLVPEALEAAVRAQVADLGLDGLLVAATHTHAGPGGYWQHAAGERLATGPYDASMLEGIAATIAVAIRRADGALAPARISVARGSARDLARSRSGGAEDGRLTVVRLERDGAPATELVVFAAHPTILGGENRRISADWPGRLTADARPGTRVLLQGAIGDQSVAGPESASPDRFGDALAARVSSLAPSSPPAGATDLAFAAVEVALPSPDPAAAPWLLRRVARNVAWGMFPASARVEAIRIGDLVLAAVPAEPVAAVAARWRAALPPGAEIASLADGYLGYVEEPSRMASRSGETVRTYFGPELAERLGEGVKLAADRVTRPAAATSFHGDALRSVRSP